MEQDKIPTIVKIGVVVLIGIILFGALGTYIGNLTDEDQMYSISTSSESDSFVSASAQTLSPTGSRIDSASIQTYNTTWLNCTTDDFLNVTITQSKATISVWFSNETTSWTSLITTTDGTYVNGTLDAGWDFLPYYVYGDDIIFCKSDASTFLDVSIDAIRVYEQLLNSTEVTEVYGYGR